MKLGIFGAQGELGTSLAERLRTIKPTEVELLLTVDREHNKEIAEQCDAAIIVVRPNQVEDLLKEIAPHLKPMARILSFAAYYPLHRLITNSGRICARGMADPWWSVAAFLCEGDFDTQGLEFIVSGLTTLPPLSLHTDAEIDAFTIHMCQLFVALLLQKQGELDAGSHLQYLSKELQSTTAALEVLIPEGNPEKLLETISTKGGISEMITTLIRSNAAIPPDDVFAEVTKAFSGRF